MFYKNEQKKNIRSGYLYMVGAVFFVLVMFFVIFDVEEEITHRIILELVVVFSIGIACVYAGIRQIKDYNTFLGGIPKPMIDDMCTKFELFKSLDVSVKDVAQYINKDMENHFVDNPIIVFEDDVVAALEKYRTHKVTDKNFLIWCNLISFSKCFILNPVRVDEIESVLRDMKRRMEKQDTIPSEMIDQYEKALTEHTEI